MEAQDQAPNRAREGRKEYDTRPRFRLVRTVVEQHMEHALDKLLHGGTPATGTPSEAQEATDEELLYQIADLTTTLLDLGDVEERNGRDETTFELTFAWSGDEAPEQGEVLLADPALQVQYQAEKVWRLRSRDTPGCEVYGVKRRLTSHGERSAAAPRNLWFGFYGTWDASRTSRRYGISPLAAWHAVLKRFGTPNWDQPADQRLREALDSRGGRHYADWLIDATEHQDGRIERALAGAESPVRWDRD